MKKILITPRSLTKNKHPVLDLLVKAGYELVFCTPGKQPDEKELMELLPGCQGYLAGVEKITLKVLESAKNLKIISRNGVGIDNIDIAAAERMGIRICRAEGANARGVAELTISLMFALVRAIPFSDAKMKNGKWERKEGLELKNHTLGIIGFGNIGKQVGAIAYNLGMKIIAFDVYQSDCSVLSFKFSYVPLEDLLKRSDIISLHCPPLKNNRPLITKEAIAKMKKGAFLVNTARASLLNETAVQDALKSSHISGLAMDVFREEPPLNNELIKHERVIATPHIGGYTSESIIRATQAAVDNLFKYL